MTRMRESNRPVEYIGTSLENLRSPSMLAPAMRPWLTLLFQVPIWLCRPMETSKNSATSPPA